MYNAACCLARRDGTGNAVQNQRWIGLGKIGKKRGVIDIKARILSKRLGYQETTVVFVFLTHRLKLSTILHLPKVALSTV